MSRLTLKFKPDYDDYLNASQAATFNRPTIVLVVLMGSSPSHHPGPRAGLALGGE